jgi:phosphoglycolate phosphatase-like HAD superfamily hydrolase
MSDPVQNLRDLQPSKQFFIGIDSDGCVFDSMEIKHKECFAPMFIKHFNLQAASKYARETWEFVNLYSKMRGINRFPALSNALDLLGKRPEVIARNVKLPTTDPLDEWISRETRLSNETLLAEVEKGNSALETLLAWSHAVNHMIEDVVRGVPPFPMVRESLAKLNQFADAVVVSQTPTSALQREWAEHDLASRVRVIAGQELGTKTEHLKYAAAGKYPSQKILMIGDAPGDFKAAKANSALFYPITPGKEESSWERFHDEALDVFFGGHYAGDYEEALVREFNACLPESPPWQTK